MIELLRVCVQADGVFLRIGFESGARYICLFNVCEHTSYSTFSTFRLYLFIVLVT